MRFQKSKVFKAICFSLIFSFLTSSITQAAPLNLPNPQQFIPLSTAYSFPVLKGLRFDPANPLKMEFIVDIWVNLSPFGDSQKAPL